MIDRIFFGKKFENKTNKKKIKELKIMFFIIYVFCVFLIGGLIYTNVSSLKVFQYSLDERDYQLKDMNVKIDYSDLEPKQRRQAMEIISQLKPKYLKFQKEIYFVKDVSGICKRCKTTEDGLKAVGLNFIKQKKIYVEWHGKLDTKRILCHELLHSILDPRAEFFVRDIDNYYVCYKDEFNPILNPNKLSMELR